MVSSSTFGSSAIVNLGSQEYPYPSDVNPAKFLSIKLSSDENNYDIWQEQMLRLVDSHDMRGYIDGTFACPQDNGDPESEAKYREWKRSDKLVKGWIYGSVSDDVMDNVAGLLHTAHDVWKKVNIAYCKTTRDKDMAEYVPLHRALLRGDWEKAEEIFNKNKDAELTELTDLGERALDVVISTCRNFQHLENILKKINPESLPTLVDAAQFNAMHRAAVVGNAIASKMLVEKNPHLLFMVDEDEYLPIHRAIINSHKSTFQYLLLVSKQHIELSQQDGYENPFEGKNGVVLITQVIDKGFFDVASKLIQEFLDMARNGTGIDNALIYITDKPDAYFSGTRYNFYQRFVYSHVPIENSDIDDAAKIQDIENQGRYNTKSVTMFKRFGFIPVIKSIYIKFWELALLQVSHIKHLHEDKVKHNAALMLLNCICEEVGKLNNFSDLSEHYGEAFIKAVENDTPEAVEAIVQCFPRAIWTMQADNCTISQIAIANRCEKVYKFLVNQVDDKYLHRTTEDDNGNNLLHLAGKLAPIHKLNLVSGAALQMQRELQWFQEVKTFVLPTYEEERNDKNETPIMVFRREHKELRKEGEEWLKKTANSYTITNALIITIAFAAAITVPGGNNGDTGEAIFATKASFIIFVVSDAISFFTSTTSLLLFLSILTARYREEDFLYMLPKRLIFGLALLFLSVTPMIIAFSATSYLLFGEKKTWILIPIAALICLPIASFVTLQFALLVELINSTYGHGIFSKQRDGKIK